MYDDYQTTELNPIGRMTNKERSIDEIVEEFANLEHERWSKWQSYLHSKCVEHSDGKGEWVCFPAELYKRWERQIATPYAELSEKEKESDREQVYPYIKTLQTERQKREAVARDIYKQMEDWQNLRTATDETTNAAQVMNKLQALTNKTK